MVPVRHEAAHSGKASKYLRETHRQRHRAAGAPFESFLADLHSQRIEIDLGNSQRGEFQRAGTLIAK